MKRIIVWLLLLFVLLTSCFVTMSLMTGTEEHADGRIVHQLLSDHESEDDEEESLLKRVLNENPLLVLVSVVVLMITTAKLPHRGRLILLGLYFVFILYMTVLFRESGER